MNKKYKTIMADPPWPIEWPQSKYIGTKELEYPVMPVAEIAALDIKDYLDNDCRLFLWTTNEFLPEALYVCRLWGFRYKMLYTWCKPTGLGGEPRIATEHIVIGYRGHPKRVGSRNDSQILNWVTANRTMKHSEKPHEIIRTLTKISEPNRLELFARTKREGWDSWGNEIINDIEIKKLEIEKAEQMDLFSVSESENGSSSS